MRRTMLLIVGSMIAAACGGGASGADAVSATTQVGGSGEQTPIVIPDATSPPAGSASPAPEPTDLPDSDYPDVVVADLATGENVNLRTLALEPQPVLLWFWAPH